MKMEIPNDLIARKLNLLTVFFPALAPSYKAIILNAFDTFSLLDAYMWQTLIHYPGIKAEDRERLGNALKRAFQDAQANCIHQYLSARFHDETIEALVKEMEGRHNG